MHPAKTFARRGPVTTSPRLEDLPPITELQEQWNMSDDCDEDDGFYAYLVRCARASERITPEGLEQVYAMSVSVSEADIDRLVAKGELEPGTLRPLRP
jgi:hypothetical protein